MMTVKTEAGLLGLCPLCADEGCVYDGACPGCRVRWIARLPRKLAGAAIKHERDHVGPEAANKLRAEVGVMHARLTMAGAL